MNYTLEIQIPENIYEYLIKMATVTGQSRESLVIEWLISGSHYAVMDPLDQYIGAFDSKGSDWAEQHDKYIGNSHIKTMKNGSET
jgi:hypothetical protein